MTASATAIIHQLRNEIIPVGGYGQYRSTCSQKILQSRRKLKIATYKGRKYEPKSIQDIPDSEFNGDSEWRNYLVFLSERAWADAMAVKTFHNADAGEKPLSGNVRSHILSRLTKASKIAARLVQLASTSTSDSSRNSLYLDYGAYWQLLEASIAFESQKWAKCLQSYSEAYIIYSAIGLQDSSGFYDDWISDNVEEYIRYAAYQLRIPRTVTIQKVVARYVQRDSKLVQEALKISPSAIDIGALATEEKSSDTAPQDLPSSISWRGRTVKLEDARIAQALGAVRKAESDLATRHGSADDISDDELAAAYESVLGPSQDAVDATKTALDELANEGVASSDSRMQSLQITRTAVNYDLIGWRIGRNRVLCGKDDGATFEEEQPKTSKSRIQKTETPSVTSKSRTEGNGRKLARLRQRVVLYETTLDSLESIRELPGIATDSALTRVLSNRRAYFTALKTLAVARSHALLGNSRKALALFAKALQDVSSISLTNDDEPGLESGLPQHYVTLSMVELVQQIAQALTMRFHALVELEDLEKETIEAEHAKGAWSAPLIERLDEFPSGGADLTNLVSYPSKLRPVPVNPIFLDVAWNYIDYPGQRSQEQEAAPEMVATEEPRPRRGWFGFVGRG